MKTFHNILKIVIGVFVIAALAVSCLPKQETMGDAGQTIVTLPGLESGWKLITLDPTDQPQSFVMIDIRRQAQNSAELNSSTTVDMTFDASGAILTAYNAQHETSYVALPDSVRTMTPALSGGKESLVFNPGDFAKELKLTIPNAFKVDMTKHYALAYKITVSGTGKLSTATADTVVVEVMAKNIFDGQYSVTGTLVDLYNGGITGNYPMTVNLVSTGQYQCRFEEPADAPWGSIIYHSIQSGGSMSVYGSFGLIVNFDASNNVASIINYYGQPAGNTRSAQLDPSGINIYDPVAKTVTIKYNMLQPSVMGTTNPLRTTFDEVWTYVGPR